MRRFLLPSMMLFVLFVLSGCGGGPKLLSVKGVVTLDGQKIGNGSDARIRFDPTTKTGTSAEGFIKDGAYAVNLRDGAYKVSILWTVPAAKKARPKMDGPGADAEEVENKIPTKYGPDGELKATVNAETLQHDFKLSSK
ncbi:MAG: hypothetical protein ACRCZF_10310 [Gemmataceae bacterium]